MKTSRLFRHLALSALTLSLSLKGWANPENLTAAALRDHVDAQVPAYLKIHSLSTRVLGNPPTKVKAELELAAAETLYRETVQEPALKSVATELTADLRTVRPRALRLLKVVTREGSVSRPMNFDFPVVGPMPGPIPVRIFESFGLPRTRFAADAVAEDTEEGRSALTAFEAGVRNYNDAVTGLDRRTATDRMLKNTTGLVDKGLTVYDRVTGRNGPAESGATPAGGFKNAVAAVNGLLHGSAAVPAPAVGTPAPSADSGTPVPAKVNPVNAFAAVLHGGR